MEFTQLKQGDRLRVLSYSTSGSKERRKKLLALGLLPGTEVSVQYIAPLGDPIAITVRETLLSLRQADFADLQWERVFS